MKTSLPVLLAFALTLGLSACSKTEEGVYSPPSKAHEQPVFPPALVEEKPAEPEVVEKPAEEKTASEQGTADTTATPATEPADV